jgi:hypothetical protein
MPRSPLFDAPPQKRGAGRGRNSSRRARHRPAASADRPHRHAGMWSSLALLAGAAAIWTGAQIHERYAFGLRFPVVIHFQSPLVIVPKNSAMSEWQAQFFQNGKRLTAYQQYVCEEFGSACSVALAIQRAENPTGKCEIYHYNPDGTLDWGYFQINTVHLQRPGLNLRDLLDCRANIDFAYQLYREKGFSPWTTYRSGAYRQYLRE